MKMGMRVPPAVQSRRRAHIRQRHLAPRGAGEVEQPQAALDVRQVGDDEPVADEQRLVHHIRPFGHDGAPVEACAVPHGRRYDAAARRLPVRVEVQPIAQNADRPVDGVLRRDDGRERRGEVRPARVLQVRKPQAIVRGTALREDEEPAPVVGDGAADPCGRVVGPLEHEPVRRGAQTVVEQLVVGIGVSEVRALFRPAKPSVVEPFPVARPRDAAELHPRHHVGEVAAGREVAQVDVLQVGPARRRGVAEGAPVGRDRPLRHGDRPVGRKHVGVEHDDGGGARRGLPVEHRLLLEAGVAAEPELSRLPHRHLGSRVVPQRREPLPDRVAPREPVQVCERERVLGRDPRLRGGRVEILEGAVRVRHAAAEVGVAPVRLGSQRVAPLLGREACGRHEEPGGEDKGAGAKTEHDVSSVAGTFWRDRRRTSKDALKRLLGASLRAHRSADVPLQRPPDLELAGRIIVRHHHHPFGGSDSDQIGVHARGPNQTRTPHPKERFRDANAANT